MRYKVQIQWLAVLLLIILPLIWMSNQNREEISTKNVFSLMDTFVSVRVFDKEMSTRDKQTAYNAVFNEFIRIDNLMSSHKDYLMSSHKDSLMSSHKDYLMSSHKDSLMSSHKDSSFISDINQSAGNRPVSVPEEIVSLISRSIKYSKITNGAFDITILPLMNLWNIMAVNPVAPSQENINACLLLTGYGDVIIKKNSIYLNKKGMGIDLGGIAKGYALDKSLEILKKLGIKKTIIDAGGDLGVYISGTENATIKIIHPRKEGTFWGQFETGSNAVATSGDYQRYFTADNRRYHHIFNPSTGYPAKKSVSVTVVHSKAETADILATSVFILGPEEGFDLLTKTPEADGLIIWKEDGNLVSKHTPGMINKYRYTAASIEAIDSLND